MGPDLTCGGNAPLLTVALMERRATHGGSHHLAREEEAQARCNSGPSSKCNKPNNSVLNAIFIIA
jgi:hypothetical protein